MSILVDKSSRVIVQGIADPAAQAHTRMCRDYGRGRKCFVAGVDPSNAGSRFEGMPLFASVKDAKRETGATVSVIYLRSAAAIAAIDEAVDAGIDLVICVSDGLPVFDMVVARRRVEGGRTRLLGPGCPGVITPGEICVGVMPGEIHPRGRIGVLARSGALTREVALQLAEFGFGESTVACIGDEAVGGLRDVDLLRLFNDDSHTDAVLVIGEAGGDAEESCTRWIEDHMTKPVVGLAIGAAAPPPGGRSPGGLRLARSPTEAAELLESLLGPALLPFD